MEGHALELLDESAEPLGARGLARGIEVEGKIARVLLLVCHERHCLGKVLSDLPLIPFVLEEREHEDRPAVHRRVCLQMSSERWDCQLDDARELGLG